MLIRLFSVAGLFALWQLASWQLGSSELPAPTDVIARLWQALWQGELLFHLGQTLVRVFWAFAIALLFGSAIGIAMGYWRRCDHLLDGALILALNIPALVTIILCYLWFGLNEVAAIGAVAINKFPTVVVTLREGTRAIDNQLLEVGKAFRVPPLRTLRHIILPQLTPYFLTAARTGLALIWKIVLVVELLGRSNGVGFQLGIFFQFFDIESILAYTLAFVVLIYTLEMLLLQPLETRINRWRQ